ncbi:subunit of tubulin prefoldin [Irineochytrium annulatum]|nr:subunit of tubulin prefoldin [Irineochytrium annulatum]
MEQINLADLPLQQLHGARSQMEEELQHLTSSYAALKQAQAKFNDGVDSLNSIAGKESRPVLVPLTNSLYLPGELADGEKVIVDIGTGYFVEKKIPDAKEYFKTKVGYLRGQLEKLQETITQRQQQHQVLIEVIQSKLDKK